MDGILRIIRIIKTLLQYHNSNLNFFFFNPALFSLSYSSNIWNKENQLREIIIFSVMASVLRIELKNG